MPKTTLSYVIDNAQEAASKVTVVKKKTRLSSATVESVATVAAASDTAAKTVKMARKPGDPADTGDATAAAAPVVRTAPKSKLVKAGKNEPAPVVIATGGTLVSQVTDAATLASIDTSGYLLPSVKVPGRRGRKPSEFTPENDEVAALNAVERAELLGLDNKSTAEEMERRRAQIKNLINMGKERGFLTYAEINDQLPKAS